MCEVGTIGIFNRELEVFVIDIDLANSSGGRFHFFSGLTLVNAILPALGSLNRLNISITSSCSSGSVRHSAASVDDFIATVAMPLIMVSST